MVVKRHELKILPQFYHDVDLKIKNFEVRKADRDFTFGDTLVLKEYDPKNGYTGRELERTINYILNDRDYVKEGYVILGIA